MVFFLMMVLTQNYKCFVHKDLDINFSIMCFIECKF